MKKIDLPIGEYQYRIKKLGYADYTGTFKVDGSDIQIAAALDTDVYEVRINPIPSNLTVEIQVNGIWLEGKVFSLQPGTYIYRISGGGYPTYEGNVTVIDEDVMLNVPMDGIKFRVLFASNYSDVVPELEIQGVYITGSTHLVEPGSYNYRVNRSGYATITGTVDITNSDKTIPIVFSEDFRKVRINTIPARATVEVQVGREWVAGKDQELSRGLYKVVAELDGYKTATRTLRVSHSDIDITIVLELEKPIEVIPRVISISETELCAIRRSDGNLIGWNIQTGSAFTGTIPQATYTHLASYKGSLLAIDIHREVKVIKNAGNIGTLPMNLIDVIDIDIADGRGALIYIDGTLETWGYTSTVPPSTVKYKMVKVGSTISAAIDENDHIHIWGTTTGYSKLDTMRYIHLDVEKDGYIYNSSYKYEKTTHGYGIAIGSDKKPYYIGSTASILSAIKTDIDKLRGYGNKEFVFEYTSMGVEGYVLIQQNGRVHISMRSGIINRLYDDPDFKYAVNSYAQVEVLGHAAVTITSNGEVVNWGRPIQNGVDGDRLNTVTVPNGVFGLPSGNSYKKNTLTFNTNRPVNISVVGNGSTTTGNNHNLHSWAYQCSITGINVPESIQNIAFMREDHVIDASVYSVVINTDPVDAVATISINGTPYISKNTNIVNGTEISVRYSHPECYDETVKYTVTENMIIDFTMRRMRKFKFSANIEDGNYLMGTTVSPSGWYYEGYNDVDSIYDGPNTINTFLQGSDLTHTYYKLPYLMFGHNMKVPEYDYTIKIKEPIISAEDFKADRILGVGGQRNQGFIFYNDLTNKYIYNSLPGRILNASNYITEGSSIVNYMTSRDDSHPGTAMWSAFSYKNTSNAIKSYAGYYASDTLADLEINGISNIRNIGNYVYSGISNTGKNVIISVAGHWASTTHTISNNEYLGVIEYGPMYSDSFVFSITNETGASKPKLLARLHNSDTYQYTMVEHILDIDPAEAANIGFDPINDKDAYSNFYVNNFGVFIINKTDSCMYYINMDKVYRKTSPLTIDVVKYTGDYKKFRQYQPYTNSTDRFSMILTKSKNLYLSNKASMSLSDITGGGGTDLSDYGNAKNFVSTGILPDGPVISIRNCINNNNTAVMTLQENGFLTIQLKYKGRVETSPTAHLNSLIDRSLEYKYCESVYVNNSQVYPYVYSFLGYAITKDNKVKIVEHNMGLNIQEFFGDHTYITASIAATDVDTSKSHYTFERPPYHKLGYSKEVYIAARRSDGINLFKHVYINTFEERSVVDIPISNQADLLKTYKKLKINIYSPPATSDRGSVGIYGLDSSDSMVEIKRHIAHDSLNYYLDLSSNTPDTYSNVKDFVFSPYYLGVIRTDGTSYLIYNWRYSVGSSTINKVCSKMEGDFGDPITQLGRHGSTSLTFFSSDGVGHVVYRQGGYTNDLTITSTKDVQTKRYIKITDGWGMYKNTDGSYHIEYLQLSTYNKKFTMLEPDAYVDLINTPTDVVTSTEVTLPLLGRGVLDADIYNQDHIIFIDSERNLKAYNVRTNKFVNVRDMEPKIGLYYNYDYEVVPLEEV